MSAHLFKQLFFGVCNCFDFNSCKYRVNLNKTSSISSILLFYCSLQSSPPAKKKKLILQNPLKNVQIGASDPEFVDDPSLHDNRIRSFPHVRGNWASYIFIDPQKEIDFGPLQNSILKFLAENHSSLECKTINGPHLSVSRVFTLQFHWISSFVQELQTKLKNDVKPFNLRLLEDYDVVITVNNTNSSFKFKLQLYS
jgi:hypothetical protein